LKERHKDAAHPSPRRRPQLGSLRGVRREMARLYQLVLSGELEAAKASRMIYVLREIRCAIESETLERLERRLTEVATTVGAVRNGHPSHTAPNQPWH
jgi:hypothetical protein